MNSLLRILIATVVACIVLLLSVTLLVYLNRKATTLAAMATIIAFTATYKALPKSKKQIAADAKDVREAKDHYPNGVIKEKGVRINGLKEGTWSTFDENGMFIKDVEYRQGTRIS